jgi:abequosyltransferase
MSQPLLTLVIPTYNRAGCLRTLLDRLRSELDTLAGRVAIVIGDNASSDETPALTAAFASAWQPTLVLRHERNFGPDENFCRCIEEVRTPYVWIIGDDDIPRIGSVKQILELLETSKPDLVYLPSRWMADVTAGQPAGPMGPLEYSSETAESFASNVNTWLTFVSGNIIRLELYKEHFDAAFARGYAGSNLLQLAWVLKVLQHGSRFIRVRTECVLATTGNTGGYSVLTVFGANFPRVVRELLPDRPRLVGAIIQRHVIGYLPSLIWQVRFANIGQFVPEDARAAVQRQLGSHVFYWFFLRPIMTLPRKMAWLFYAVARAVSRLTRQA